MTVNVPGPTEILPNCPDAIIDLQTLEGAALVGGQWRYSDTTVQETSFVAVGPDLGPSGLANRTYEVIPHAQAADFDDTDVDSCCHPAETRRRLSTGRVCFNWYRITVTIPERVGDLDPAGCTVVFETVIDDYAEIWVNGEQPAALGDTGGQVVGGLQHPQPRGAYPTTRVPASGSRSPCSASMARSPRRQRNYIWMRTATVDFYTPSSLGARPKRSPSRS